MREITYQDIKDLLAIEREVYAGELPWTMSAFMAELGSKAPHLYLLAAINGKQLALLVVGFKERMTHYECRCPYSIPRLRFRSFFNRRNANFAKKNRCETLSLEVRMSNVKSPTFVSKIGFALTNGEKGYYDENNETH